MLPNDSLTCALSGSALSAGISLVCYLTFRWLESKFFPHQDPQRAWKIFTKQGFLYKRVFYFIAPWLGIFLVVYGWALLVGGWFHRRAGGCSRNTVIAGGVVGLAAFSTQFLGFRAMSFYQLGWIVFDEWGEIAFYAGLWVYPVFSPLLVWIWRSLRLRPGFDVPFAETEATIP